jgi:hypothetical protein
VRVWVLRVLWVTLPLSAGAAATDVLDGWRDAPAIVAAALLWLVWGIGTVALLAPRPQGLTALRAAAPAFATLAIVATAAGGANGLAAAGAVVATSATAALVAVPDVAVAAANGISYGDEQRFPLRVPPLLFLAPIPVVWMSVVGGLAGGPLLLADGEIAWGAVAFVLGIPVVAFGARALHGLSRRWLILVPAGVVILDPMTLAEPVLFVRRQVRRLRPLAANARVHDDALDLRLGATRGSVVVELADATDLLRARRGRRGGTTVQASTIVIAVVQRAHVLQRAAQRRVHVEVPQRSAT